MEPFKVHILGCGSAMPTLRHYASAQVVEVRDKLFLVDCGEGTQMQLRKSRLRFGRINHVFISHLHGDHCLGLAGMLSTFGMLGRTAPLHIFSPKGLQPVLDAQLACFCHGLDYPLVYHEVDTAREAVVYEDRSVTVTTIPLRHRMPCCGYLFREHPTLPHIKRDIFDMYGISISQVNNVKNGHDGVTPDGDIIPNEKLVTPAAPPRAYAYCSDTRYIPDLYKRLKGVTTLYHESTYGKDSQLAAKKYMHSTAEEAAMVARDAGVKKLVLGHYSSRYDDERVLLDEARKIFRQTVLADENMVVDV
mgnify:CR=1 FL=1